MLFLTVILLAVAIGAVALSAVAVANSTEADQHRPWVAWPAISLGALISALSLVLLLSAAWDVWQPGSLDGDEMLAVLAAIVGWLMFGPVGVLLILLGLDLLHRRPLDSKISSRRVRAALATFGYVLCCGAPALLFPPFAGLFVAGLLTAFAVLRLNRQGHLLWLLAIAVERGFPLPDELRACAVALGGRMGGRLEGLAERLESGQSLSESLTNPPGLVPRTALMAVRVGEETGRLPAALRESAVRSTGTVSGFRQSAYITGGVAYVWGVMLVLLAVVSFCMYYIVPKYKEIFEDFDIALPQVTRVLLELCDFAVASALFTVPALLALFAATCFAAHWYQRGWQNLSVPWLTRWFPRLDTPDILRNLAHAVDTRTTLPVVLESMAQHHHRPHIRARLQDVANSVVGGQDAWVGLQRTGLLRAPELELIASAERVGNLAWSLRDVADRIERDRGRRFERWYEFLRPWPVLLLGALVALFVIGMFLPLVSLISELT